MADVHRATFAGAAVRSAPVSFSSAFQSCAFHTSDMAASNAILLFCHSSDVSVAASATDGSPVSCRRRYRASWQTAMFSADMVMGRSFSRLSGYLTVQLPSVQSAVACVPVAVALLLAAASACAVILSVSRLDFAAISEAFACAWASTSLATAFASAASDVSGMDAVPGE